MREEEEEEEEKKKEKMRGGRRAKREMTEEDVRGGDLRGRGKAVAGRQKKMVQDSVGGGGGSGGSDGHDRPPWVTYWIDREIRGRG